MIKVLIKSNNSTSFDFMKEKSKGGKRSGAGRKPSTDPKQLVTMFVETSIINALGGKEGVRGFLYGCLEPPDPEKKILSPDQEIKQKAPKAEKRPIVTDLTKPTNVLQPQEQPKTNYSVNTKAHQKEAAPVDVLRNADIQDKIWAIKSEKCPKERDTTLGKKSWELEQKKRIQELEGKLKS
jgi:hypothetical protein